MAITQAYVDQLDFMISTGVLETEGKDQKRVKFNSIDQLIAARDYFAKKLQALNGPISPAGFASFADGDIE